MLAETSGVQHPGGVVLYEADVGVVVDGLGGGEQDDAAWGGFEDFAEEFLADALALAGFADAEVAAIGHIEVVGETSGGAGEGCAVPGRDQEVGVVEHVLDGVAVAHRAAFAQGGGV